ncbi:hypothetical protein A1O3_10223 [Capronia epimyces CBS 606.96]|uniref:Pentacotripeptide-repeat region of PRORP domain-containing protein n=1 Tax=Capronia epimyces CBS 606.96 TaxID=1182542 RepID=W9XI89_9EURO|nr:uncharacterized protein A1O3_10223 [Capronia epimyces CBS 606.96]EXJ77065.1 hypothetical protein A1O3_10223 [Capronia epimyces CBS 606.96]
MHRLLAHHGLIQNFRILALRAALPRVTLRVEKRGYNGTRGTVAPGKNGNDTPRAIASTLRKHRRLQPGLGNSGRPGLTDGLTEGTGGPAGRVKGLGDPASASPSPGPDQPQAHGADKQDTKPQKEENTVLPERKYMRRILGPKRFPPLLREIQRVGQDHKISKTGRLQKSLDRTVISTAILEAELKWICRNHPHPKAVRNILEILIHDRKVKPSAAHYEALILANCFPELGSVKNVKIFLEEMEREGVLIEPSTYYAVLTVLAVHPDTYLRTTIIQQLRKQWVSIPERYALLNVVAMIREGQLELATLEMEKLQQKQTRIPPWVWIIYVHAICDRHDFQALLQLLYKLSDEGFLFPRPTLLHALITASKNDSLDVTKYLWHGYVESMHIMPNEDLCMTVLRLAARYQDVKLAESVAVVLESVAGDACTTPPSLVDQPPPTKHEIMSLTFDSPHLPGLDPQQRPGSDGSGDGSITTSSSSGKRTPSSSESEAEVQSLAVAFSSPVPLPHPSSWLRPRKLPEQAVQLLRELGIETSWQGRNRRRAGILYPLFKQERGLRGARFDPRLALMQGWDWRKK